MFINNGAAQHYLYVNKTLLIESFNNNIHMDILLYVRDCKYKKKYLDVAK